MFKKELIANLRDELHAVIKDAAKLRSELWDTMQDRDRWKADCKRAWRILQEIRLDDIRRNGT